MSKWHDMSTVVSFTLHTKGMCSFPHMELIFVSDWEDWGAIFCPYEWVSVSGPSIVSSYCTHWCPSLPSEREEVQVRESEWETERGRDRVKEKVSEKQRERETERGRDREERESEWEIERERERQRERAVLLSLCSALPSLPLQPLLSPSLSANSTC